jgi:hypothetical protein
MPNRPRAPTSALACRRAFEPARQHPQLRSQAYQHLVPPGRSRNGRLHDLGGPPPPDPTLVSVSASNPQGGICA